MGKFMRMKTWKKILLCVFTILVVAMGTVYADLNTYKARGGFVLEYHAIGKHADWPDYMYIEPDVFESHLQELQSRGLKMVTVEELAQVLRRGEDAGKYVALSFDDGYIDDYQGAFPLLKKYNARGTFHIIPNRIGLEGYMNEAQIKEMLEAGMEIGSHTYSHAILTEIDPKYYEWEIGVSKYTLEKKFPGLKVTTLAYPCGLFNDDIKAALKKYGYKQALTGHTGANLPETYAQEPYEMYRVIVVDDGTNSNVFAWTLNRAYLHGHCRFHGLDIGD